MPWSSSIIRASRKRVTRSPCSCHEISWFWQKTQRRLQPLKKIVTEEIRERGRRVGFSIERFGGERGVLAHVDLPGPPRVGRYGVDLVAFERLAIPALEQAGEVAIVDELGKMELASDAFREAFAA